MLNILYETQRLLWSPMASTLHTLHGDGVSEHFFELLWTKDELNFGPSVNIPDTIVFRYGKPTHWYFTGVDGKMKKKNKQNLLNVRIEEAMTKRALGCDVVASYIETTEGADESNQAEGAGALSRIEYFDRKGLHDFLYNRFKQESGVLQRFIEPQGTSNSLVRAIWSPKVCLLERRINQHQLQDQRFGLYERAVTYEGPEYLSVAAPLRGEILPSSVQQLCDEVVQHISEVSFQKQQIARMVLNLKVDSRDRIWLCYSSSIRLASEMVASRSLGGAKASAAPLNIGDVIKLPKHVKLNNQASHVEGGRPRRVLRYQSCISCACSRPLDMFHPCSYKAVTNHFDQVMLLMRAAAPHQPGQSNSQGSSSYSSSSSGGARGGGGGGGGGGGTMVWPPDPEIVAAAGGVGFGMSRFNEDQKRRQNDHGGEFEEEYGEDEEQRLKRASGPKVTEEDLVIPPMLRHLHPKLSANVYQRYRKDPLFLYKTSLVCEDCYLVFAELSSAPSVTSSMLRQPAPPPAGPIYGNNNSHGSGTVDWATVELPNAGSSSKHHQGKQRRRSNNKLKNMKSSMSSSSNSQEPPQLPAAPSFPSAIHDSHGIAAALQASYGSFGSVAGDGGSGSGGQNEEEEDHDATQGVNVEAIIQAREDAFFKEIGAEPTLRAGHPLTHLVTSHNKLQALQNNANTQAVTGGVGGGCGMGGSELLSMSGGGGSRGGGRSRGGGGGGGLGSSSSGFGGTISPYAQPMALVEVGRADNSATAKTMTRSQRNSQNAEKLLRASAGGGGGGGGGVAAMSQSSAKHRDFLLSTLNEVQHQLTTPNALKSFVESHTMRGGGGGSSAGGDSRLGEDEEGDGSEFEDDEEDNDEDDEEYDERGGVLEQDEVVSMSLEKQQAAAMAYAHESSAHESVHSQHASLNEDVGKGGRGKGGGGAGGQLQDLGTELLRTAHQVDQKFLAIKVYEKSVPDVGVDRGRPLLLFDIVFPLKSQRWSLPVDILSIGLEPGAWEAMPLDEKQALATHMLDELQWIGDNQQDLRFTFG